MSQGNYSERPDRWMLTIINMTWTVDDLQYRHWIYTIDSRMYSAAEAAVYVANVLISFRGRGAQLSCWVSSIRQNYSSNSMWKVQAAIDFAHLLLITCNSIGLIYHDRTVLIATGLPQVNGGSLSLTFQSRNIATIATKFGGTCYRSASWKSKCSKNRQGGLQSPSASSYLLLLFFSATSR